MAAEQSTSLISDSPSFFLIHLHEVTYICQGHLLCEGSIGDLEKDRQRWIFILHFLSRKEFKIYNHINAEALLKKIYQVQSEVSPPDMKSRACKAK